MTESTMTPNVTLSTAPAPGTGKARRDAARARALSKATSEARQATRADKRAHVSKALLGVEESQRAKVRSEAGSDWTSQRHETIGAALDGLKLTLLCEHASYTRNGQQRLNVMGTVVVYDGVQEVTLLLKGQATSLDSLANLDGEMIPVTLKRHVSLKGSVSYRVLEATTTETGKRAHVSARLTVSESMVLAVSVAIRD